MRYRDTINVQNPTIIRSLEEMGTVTELERGVQRKFVTVPQLHLLFPGGDEALKLLEPVLHEDHFVDGLGSALLKFHHQESFAVEGDIPPGSPWEFSQAL